MEPKQVDKVKYNAEEDIRKMRREGWSWSDVYDYITRQVGYNVEVIEWARKVYYSVAEEYEENLPLDLQKELADLKAMREASRIKG